MYFGAFNITFTLNYFQLERRDVVASQTLRAALTKAEQAHPGLSYDIVMSVLKKGDLNVNLNESILRLQGGACETDCKFGKSIDFEFELHNILFNCSFFF